MDTLATAIRGKRFEPSKRGYSKRAVDAFLEEMAEAVARLEEAYRQETVRSQALRRRVEISGDAVDSVEAAYIAAAEAKQKLLDEATSRANQILHDAEVEAERIVAEPRLEAQRTRKEAEDILLQAKARLEAAEREARKLANSTAGRVDEARAEADRIRARAARDAEAMIADATRERDEILTGARTDALVLVEQSQRESAELVAATKDERDEIVRALTSLKVAVADMLAKGARGSEAIRVVLDEESRLRLTTPDEVVL
jgi:DivIVA domain-containing protein